MDPNIGLWNDRVNPNWRFTFTDLQTKEKQRIPYAVSIQHRGPHAELAVRLQFGYVSCDGTLAAVPNSVTVESGWEVTIPLPMTGVRLCHTVLRAPGIETPLTVYCIDCPIGLSLGFQQAVSGAGVKGAPETTWRNEAAMLFFIAAALWSAYGLATILSTWQDFIQDLSELGEDEMTLAFKALDQDGDGYITRSDIHAFMREADASSLLGQDLDADTLFNALDPEGSGRVSLEQFTRFMEAAQQMAQLAEQRRQHGPGAMSQFSHSPLPGLVGTGLSPPVFVPQLPTRRGPQTPSW